ncbi:PhoX family protein [Haloferacaceae archaeon DSL9]
MFDELRRRETLHLVAVAALGPGKQLVGRRSTEDGHDHDEGGPTLNRVATTVLGSEITGLCISPSGDLFFNVQNPEEDNEEPYDHGGVGVVTGVSLHDVPRDFSSVQVPEDDDERRVVRTAFGEYQTLMNGGDETTDGRGLGIPYSPDGEALTDANGPDFNGFVPVEGAPDEGYLFTNWETRPGMVSRMRIRRAGNGWEVLESQNIDFRDVEGTWANCFGTVSPWGTPLSSEENFSAAETPRWNDADWQVDGDESVEEVENLAAYLGYYPNPYRYGYIVEITEAQSEAPTPVKRFAMGRFAHETAVVMPDERTVYLSDDGSGKAIYKFVADEPGDLSAGTLYAARSSQDGGDDTATVGFDIEWLELAHGEESEIESWIAEYDGIDQDDYEEDETSYITEDEIEEWADGDADDDRVAFLETMAAAEAKGATDEFRKVEGLNVRAGAQPGDYLYVAMSKVDGEMADDEGDIRLDGNEYGAVYRLPLERDFDVARMEPAVTGGPDANICGGCPYDADPNSSDTVCQDCSFNPLDEDASGVLGTHLLSSNTEVDPENTVANPDNIVVLPDGRVLIGEDTSEHESNMIWLYAPEEA